MATTSPAPVSTSLLTLKYSSAAVSALVATFGALLVVAELFGLWTDGASSILLLAGYTGIVTTAIVSTLFSVLAFVLYRGVTKDVAVQPDYITKSAYGFITNAFFAILAGVLVILAARLVSVLLSSLLLIGTDTDIAGLYLGQFLPDLLAAAVIGFVGFMALKIMKGKNYSTLMTIVLMSLAGALLLAVLITVPIKAHSGSSTDYNKYYDYPYDINN